MKDFIKISGTDNTGRFSLQISGEVPGCPDKDAGDIASKYADMILEDMRCAAVRARPDFQETKQKRLGEYKSYFTESGYENFIVQERENKYWNNYYGLDKPWAFVYTDIGDFVIGWRKRVIHLEYSGIRNFRTEKVFPNENVTKYDNVIHCWGPEKCKEYLKTIRNYKLF